MQVLDRDGSASFPLLSFLPWAPQSRQPQEFVFAGSTFPHYPCLLNPERAACGAGTASFPMIPHVLRSLIKSGNNCYIPEFSHSSAAIIVPSLCSVFLPQQTDLRMRVW